MTPCCFKHIILCTGCTSALCRSVSKLFVFIILSHNERLFIKFLVLSYKAINNLIYSIVMEAATYDR